MSKRAEQAALKRFPVEMTRIPYQDLIEAFGGKEYVDFNSMPRGYFQLGYEQAEKDTIEKIRQEIERLKKILEESTYYLDNSQQALGYSFALDDFKEFIDSLPEETSCIYDTNELTPTPSVNIEDVARVQFASHAHVFDRKRKAVFNWEQFKEVVGIFYGFGKKNSLPEETCKESLQVHETCKENTDSFTSDLNNELENYYGRVPDDDDKINAARHFAEWGASRV